MKLTKSISKALAGSLLLGASSIASANLIVNGSFEDNDVPTGTWRWYAAADVNGWDGSNIEIWDHLNGEPAYHGQQFAELNAHPQPTSAFSIYQDFATVSGQTYDVSFAYQARRSTVDETFTASILGFDFTNGQTTLDSWTLNDHTTDGWSVFSGSFVANSASSRIQFTTVTPETYTYGNFLDDVRVTTAVSEPASVALLGLGLAGLGFARRRASK